MSVICPKCAHQRGPAESCPEWQCPACGIAYAKFLAAQNKPQNEPVKPREIATASKSMDAGESRSGSRKVISLVAGLLGFCAVRYGFALLREPPSTPVQTQTQMQMENPALLQQRKDELNQTPTAKTVSQEPELPTESLKDLFISAHERGEANGIGILTYQSRNRGNNLPKFDLNSPVAYKVVRESSLFRVGCDRFEVSITQGGNMEGLPGGRQAKSPIRARLVYSLNYCINGEEPEEGRNLVVANQ
jgi:hypothetical protein